ncbi:MAG: glycoside hydrolase family 2 protein [Promethearchaeati archaeon]
MVKNENIPRPEYPRPQLVRKNNWINLNGIWKFAFDDNNEGLKEEWYRKQKLEVFNEEITVPFCFQSKLSGINDNSFHDVVWYCRKFTLVEDILHKRILLHFGAVDYSAKAYINGEFVGSHDGGYTPFTCDITNFAEKENIIVLRAEDPSIDNEIPRGKQYWEKEPKLIFYPRVSGIWQTVWLEFVNNEYYIKDIKITPNIGDSSIIIECQVSGKGNQNLRIKAFIENEDKRISEYQTKLDFLGKIEKKRKRRNLVEMDLGLEERLLKVYPLNSFKFKMKIPEEQLNLWNIEHPFLYDLILTIYNKETGERYDKIRSYFGMREISISDNVIKISKSNRNVTTKNKVVLLNKKPIYQKLFLVQGYWSDGLYTAPSDEAFKKDIEFIKDFGFNGLRTHQKAFDPRFLYWCDKKGVLIWSELGAPYTFSIKAQERFINEYIQMIERDYNHPSIIAWTIFNEGWGVPGANSDIKKMHYTLSMYYLVKSLDSTRLVIDDDGWFHAKTDLCTKHFYHDSNLLPKDFNEEIEMKYPEAYESAIYLEDFDYQNEPIIYSEIGGFHLDLHNNIDKAVGYGKVESPKDLLNRVVNLLKEFDKRKEYINGICYTELYDQFQEINGLLTIEREPKFPPQKLKEQIDNLFY